MCRPLILTFGDDKFGYYETIVGGAGAGPTWNGVSGVHTHCTNTRIEGSKDSFVDTFKKYTKTNDQTTNRNASCLYDIAYILGGREVGVESKYVMANDRTLGRDGQDAGSLRIRFNNNIPQSLLNQLEAEGFDTVGRPSLAMMHNVEKRQTLVGGTSLVTEKAFGRGTSSRCQSPKQEAETGQRRCGVHLEKCLDREQKSQTATTGTTSSCTE